MEVHLAVDKCLVVFYFQAYVDKVVRRLLPNLCVRLSLQFVLHKQLDVQVLGFMLGSHLVNSSNVY